MNETVIKVENISKQFAKVRAVDSLNFEVPGGSCFGLLGPNGAGKTTMMKMLYGRTLIDKQCPGTVSVFGYDPRSRELEIKYLSGVVSQEDNLDDELNVIQNLDIYTKFYDMAAEKASERISYLLDFMELGERAKDKIRHLSGGMKRRLVIARALLNEPRLLILDEPTTGLDPQVRHLIWAKINQLKKQGTTVLLTTHYMDEAFQLCDELAIMHKGKKVMQGSPARLLEENIEKYVLEIHESVDFSGEFDTDIPQSIRIDSAGEITRLYSYELEQLHGVVELLGDRRYHLRQSNLEDVFLRSTGAKLNEKQ